MEIACNFGNGIWAQGGWWLHDFQQSIIIGTCDFYEEVSKPIGNRIVGSILWKYWQRVSLENCVLF